MAGRRLLLVDDDVPFRGEVRDLLEGHGYAVETAADGLEAWLALRRLPPDLLVMEVGIPKVDGTRLCGFMREVAALRRIPLLLLTVLGPRDLVRFPALRADAYVAKGPVPSIAESLVAALKGLEAYGRPSGLANRIYGYEGFRPRRLNVDFLAAQGHHRQVMDRLPQGVVEADEGLRIVGANVAATAILGRREMELVGVSLPDLFEPEDARAVRTALGRLAGPQGPNGPLTVRTGPRRTALTLYPLGPAPELEGVLAFLEPSGLYH